MTLPFRIPRSVEALVPAPGKTCLGSERPSPFDDLSSRERTTKATQRAVLEAVHRDKFNAPRIVAAQIERKFTMATILCDFIEIVGDAPKAVTQTSPGTEVPLPSFNTGRRVSNQTALLLFSARNLEGSAQVFINNHLVGGITAAPGSVFSTQLIAVSGTRLNDGANEIVLRSVTDPFEIKDLICFFHQTD